MSDTTTKVFSQLSTIFSATEEALTQWQGEGNMQFPTLLGMLATKFAWTDKQVREIDPLIRYYVRNSDDWYVTRGAKGGIMRNSDKVKKQEALSAKEALKKQMKAKIEQTATMSESLGSSTTMSESSDSSNLEDSLVESESFDDEDFEDDA